MAKTYAESVKLPNLVVNVPHPSTKYLVTKNGLNIEGRNKSDTFNKDDLEKYIEKMSYDIRSLIEQCELLIPSSKKSIYWDHIRKCSRFLLN